MLEEMVSLNLYELHMDDSVMFSIKKNNNELVKYKH